MIKRALTCVLPILLISNVSYAEPSVGLKLEPGIAVPFVAPQNQRFDPGFGGAAKGLVGITSSLDVGASISTILLPSKQIDNFGTAWTLGPTVRVKRSYDNASSGLAAASPWIDADLQYVRTGPLNKVGVSVGAGLSVPVMDRDRNYWVGPFVRYQDILQTDKPGYDNTDAHILIAGLSLEWRFGTRRSVQSVEPCKCKTIECPSQQTPAVNTTSMFKLEQKVQFFWDSYVIHPSQHFALDEVYFRLASNQENLEVEGHASSEGDYEHNVELSRNRARAVINYLVNKGIDRNRFSAVWFGSSKPLVNDYTEIGKISNRRVEFNLVFSGAKQ